MKTSWGYSLSLTLGLLFSGCGGSDPSSTTQNDAQTFDVNTTDQNGSDSNLSAELIKEVNRPVIDADALVRANAQLNADMYKALAEEGENLFYSPFSVISAMSMTYAGAQGQTKAEFEQVLHYDENLSVHESFNMLLSKNNPEHNIFNIANSIWPQEGYPFKEDFIYTVETGYFSEVNFKDYVNDYENARLDINAWIEEKTEEKLVDVIPSGALDPLTRLVLVNALYFKGTWEYEFDKNETDQQSFFLSDGSEKNCDMMHIEGAFAYYDAGTMQLLKLPYKEHEFSMVIALPKSAELMENAEHLLFTQYSIAQYLPGMHETDVVVSLPKFKIKWGTESLMPIFKAAGMVEAFNPRLADFTDMWYRQGDENLFIADVLHQTFIEVNEEGAEAAAATVVIVSDLSGMTPEPVPEVFTADHPFLFFIIDEQSGMILFSGKVEDPTR